MRLTGSLIVATLLLVLGASAAQTQRTAAVEIPKTWDDAEIARHEIPLADPAASPPTRVVRLLLPDPVRPIYKGYPVYAPGHEPSGYMDWLKQQDPVIVWDDGVRGPPLQTEADWIRAGAMVFEAPISGNTNIVVDDVRNQEWLEKTATPIAEDGTLPYFQYIVRRKGVVELGNLSCAM